MVSEDFKKDVDIATNFIIKIGEMEENKGNNFDELLLRELDKSDLTKSQKKIVKSSML